MDNWLFALVVLGVGALLAFTLDRMRHLYKIGQTGGEIGRRRKERDRWLTYWFSGRFPTKEEEKELDSEVEQEEERDREKFLEQRRKRPKS